MATSKRLAKARVGPCSDRGYLIDLASSEEVKGRKAARVEGQQNAFIEMTVMRARARWQHRFCHRRARSTYDLKKQQFRQCRPQCAGLHIAPHRAERRFPGKSLGADD